MRVLLLAAVATATLVTASPALAQSNPGRSMADRNADMRTSRNNNFNQGLDEFNRLTMKDKVRLAAEYRKQTDSFRTNAMQIAEQAKTATLPDDAAARIRAALEADIVMWEESFNVPKKERKAMRDAWLVDVGSLTGAQWAAQRANWYGARDSWIDQMLTPKR